MKTPWKVKSTPSLERERSRRSYPTCSSDWAVNKESCRCHCKEQSLCNKRLVGAFSNVLKPIERAAADLAVDREGVGLVRDREVVQLAAAEKPRGAAGGANLCASLCSPNVLRAFVLATDRLQKSVFGSLLDLYVHR